MNNKGFAVSGIFYTALIIFLLIISIALFNVQSKKTTLDKLKTTTMENVECENYYNVLLNELDALKSKYINLLNKQDNLITFRNKVNNQTNLINNFKTNLNTLNNNVNNSVKSVTKSGSTIKVTKNNNSTNTFTDSNDNTTYSLSKSGSTIYLKGNNGSSTSVTDGT